MSAQMMVLAGGCFWGLEELFRNQPGVIDTDVGYAGGNNENPTYENHPGHAEAIRLTYDPKLTSYKQLLDFFFRVHDPTTKDRQGNDVGTSYRSVVFYTSDDEHRMAEAMIRTVDASGLYARPVVTTLEKLNMFYAAEDYHQDYLQKHPGGYTCHFVREEQPFADTN